MEEKGGSGCAKTSLPSGPDTIEAVAARTLHDLVAGPDYHQNNKSTSNHTTNNYKCKAEKVTGRDLDGDGDVGMRSCPVSKQTGTSCPAFRNPAFTMPKYPPLPEKLPTQAEHVVLTLTPREK